MKYLFILLLIAAGVQVNAQTNRFDAIAEQAAKETDQKMIARGCYPDFSMIQIYDSLKNDFVWVALSETKNEAARREAVSFLAWYLDGDCPYEYAGSVGFALKDGMIEKHTWLSSLQLYDFFKKRKIESYDRWPTYWELLDENKRLKTMEAALKELHKKMGIAN